MNTNKLSSDGIPEEQFDPSLTPNQILNIQRDRIARKNYEKVHGPIPKGPEWNGHRSPDQVLHSYNLKLRKCLNVAEQTKENRKNGRMSAQDEDRRYRRS